MNQALAGIYVPLDVLLDTRIGTVAKLGGTDLVLKVLNGNYHARQADKFPDVDVGAFNTAYANRDVETLTLSTLTEVISLMRKVVTTLIEQAIVRPFHEGVRIVVNTYPYQLSDEDTQQIMRVLAVKMDAFNSVEQFNIPFHIEPIHLSDKELTPEYCIANFAAMLMYDYGNWLSTQQRALLRRPMPQVSLFAPAIYFFDIPTEEDLNEHKAQVPWAPFETMEKAVRGGVHLQLLPVELFSVVKPTTR